MANSGGKITAPVSFSDVNTVLGTSHTDLGNLCKDTNIKMWAKYKPVRSSAIDTISGQWDSTNNKWKSTANWWKGTDGACGLAFTGFSSLGTPSTSNTFLYQLRRNALPWIYNKPQGGTLQVFRLQDFACYIHYAECPVGDMAGAGRTIYIPSTGTGLELSLNWDIATVDEDNLSVVDFSYNGISLSDFYLAVMMWKSDTSYFLVSSDNKIGANGGMIVKTTVGYSDIGTYTVYPFFSSVKITRGGSLQSGAYLSVFGKVGQQIILASSGSSVSFGMLDACWVNAGKTRIGLKALLSNNISTSRTFTGGFTFYIYETNTGASSGAGGTLKAQYNYSTTFTIAGNSTYEIPATLYDSTTDDYYFAFLDVTAQSGKEYWVTARPNDGSTFDNIYEPVQEVIMPDI